MTYLSADIADQFDRFVIKREEVLCSVDANNTTNYNVLSLLKFLYPLLGSSLTLAELYSGSNIGVKRSFLRYMNLCTKYDFVRRIDTKTDPRYYITYKGRIMLELFMQKNI